jgi:hypothetical protein
MLRLYRVTNQLKYSLYRIRAFELALYNKSVAVEVAKG